MRSRELDVKPINLLKPFVYGVEGDPVFGRKHEAGGINVPKRRPHEGVGSLVNDLSHRSDFAKGLGDSAVADREHYPSVSPSDESVAVRRCEPSKFLQQARGALTFAFKCDNEFSPECVSLIVRASCSASCRAEVLERP